MIIVGVLPGAAPAGEVDVSVAGLRSATGVVTACLVSDESHFPNCRDDPRARHASTSAAQPNLRFSDLPSGSYAIAVIHDENGNAKLDTLGGIPREGVGFSRNPRLMFGPPKFASARFSLKAGAVREQVRIKYFL